MGAGSAITVTVPVAGGTAPAIAGPTAVSAVSGTAFTTTVTTTGTPAPAVTESGNLPAGVTFKDNGDGTATLSGTPAAGSGGTYPLTITATNSAGKATGQLTISVSQPPAITSKASATAGLLTRFTFTVTSTGTPTAAISETGALPLGFKFTPASNGTATITGTALLPGVYHRTLTARNSAGTTTQPFTLTLTL
ncbi:putative Ig domain-containing protein [Streptomyces sp. NPDC048361]|uniref:putative Ig domain-containing protein n=1 Tax=Streptomyces sp. NPDC048361 TaxID=3154720 RepID=UPI00342EAF5F